MKGKKKVKETTSTIVDLKTDITQLEIEHTTMQELKLQQNQRIQQMQETTQDLKQQLEQKNALIEHERKKSFLQVQAIEKEKDQLSKLHDEEKIKADTAEGLVKTANIQSATKDEHTTSALNILQQKYLQINTVLKATQMEKDNFEKIQFEKQKTIQTMEIELKLVKKKVLQSEEAFDSFQRQIDIRHQQDKRNTNLLNQENIQINKNLQNMQIECNRLKLELEEINVQNEILN